MAESHNAYILNTILPEWSEFFLNKGEDYEGVPSLGPAGEFVHLHRKYWKLHNSVWEGVELTGDSTEEVALDMIGHLFLMIAELRKERTPQAKPTGRVLCYNPDLHNAGREHGQPSCKCADDGALG